MLRITGVVKHLLIINVLMYLGTILLGEPSNPLDLINQRETDFSLWGRFQLAMFFPASDYFRPFQLVTHMFMHGDPMHLFFNMFALFIFGPALEASWGPQRFLKYYFITGFGALLLHLFVRWVEIAYLGESPYAVNVPVLGASGAVFGLLAGYAMLFPNNRLMLLFPPIPIKAKYLVLGYAAIELFMGLGSFQTGVAHFAHLGGALFGVLIILYWRNRGNFR